MIDVLEVRTDAKGRAFKVGQKVVWTVTTGKGKVISMRASFGVITFFPLDDPAVAEVQRMYDKHKGPKSIIPLSALTVEGEPTTLTKFVEAVHDAVSGDHATHQP